MTYSEQIITKVQQMQKETSHANFADKKVLATDLLLMQQVIAASENLMVQAEKLSKEKMKEYFKSHLDEELDHAKWLADDLLTWDIDVTKHPIMREAAELAGLQYYLIFHRSPACLLGYMMVLEGLPFPIDVLEQLEEVHGKDILKTLRYHAVNDLEHRKELFSVVNDSGDPCIMENAIRTQMLMSEISEKLSRLC